MLLGPNGITFWPILDKTMAHTSVSSESLPDSVGVNPLAAELLAKGLEAYAQADLTKALEVFKEAEYQAEIGQLGQIKAQILVAQGKVYRDLGEPNRALEGLDQALVLSQDHADTVIEGIALNQRAGVNHNLGEYALALRDLTRSLELVEDVRLTRGEGGVEVIGRLRAGPTTTSIFPLRLGRQTVHPFVLLFFFHRRELVTELLRLFPRHVLHRKPVGVVLRV